MNAVDDLALPSELQQIAFEEFGETSEKRVEYIAELRRRILLLPENDRITDLSEKNLLRFLRGRKFNLDKTLEATITMHRFIVEHPEVFDFDEENEVQPLVDLVTIVPQIDLRQPLTVVMSPKRILSKLTPDFISQYPMALLRTSIFVLRRISFHPIAQVNGICFFGTFQGCTFWDNLTFSKVAPVQHHLLRLTYIKALSTRMKAFTIFEEPTFISYIWPMIRIFLSEKLRQRFQLAGGRYHERLQEVFGDIANESTRATITQLIFDILHENFDKHTAVEYTKEFLFQR